MCRLQKPEEALRFFMILAALFVSAGVTGTQQVVDVRQDASKEKSPSALHGLDIPLPERKKLLHLNTKDRLAGIASCYEVARVSSEAAFAPFNSPLTKSLCSDSMTPQ